MLHSSVPFKIVVNFTPRWILRTIVDEGDSVRILSSTAWQALGSPRHVPATYQIPTFNRRPIAPLGTLPCLPITLGGKTIYIDVMVFQGPLDFNILLGRDYVYAMKAIVSTLFRVMHFLLKYCNFKEYSICIFCGPRWSYRENHLYYLVPRCF